MLKSGRPKRAGLTVICVPDCQSHLPVASATRTALKNMADSRGKLFGKECIAANIALAVNKLKYKDDKGDHRGFIDFLEDALYRKPPSRVVQDFMIIDFFLDLLKSEITCSGLSTCILEDMKTWK